MNKKLTLHVSGQFSSHNTKVKGTMKITGGCRTGKQRWSARGHV